MNHEDIIKKLDLSVTQQDHFKPIKWLLFGPMGSGKSYLMGLAFVKHAMENEGLPIYFFDHKVGRCYIQNITKNILKIINEIEMGGDFEISYSTNSITYKPKVGKK